MSHSLQILLVMDDGGRARAIADALTAAANCPVVIAPNLRMGRLLHARGGWSALVIDGALTAHPDLPRLKAQNELFGRLPLVFVRETGGQLLLSGLPGRLDALVHVLDPLHGAAA